MVVDICFWGVRGGISPLLMKHILVAFYFCSQINDRKCVELNLTYLSCVCNEALKAPKQQCIISRAVSQASGVLSHLLSKQKGPLNMRALSLKNKIAN